MLMKAHRSRTHRSRKTAGRNAFPERLSAGRCRLLQCAGRKRERSHSIESGVGKLQLDREGSVLGHSFFRCYISEKSGQRQLWQIKNHLGNRWLCKQLANRGEQGIFFGKQL